MWNKNNSASLSFVKFRYFPNNLEGNSCNSLFASFRLNVKVGDYVLMEAHVMPTRQKSFAAKVQFT